MTLCHTCGCCEEHCLCTQPNFITDDTVGACKDCMLLDRREIELTGNLDVMGGFDQ